MTRGPQRPLPDDVVSIQELRTAGWSEAAVRRAVRAGHLHRVLPGTYSTRPLLDDEFRLAAAAAYLGDEVVAVLGSAARLHGLPAPWPGDGRAHVALPPGREHVQRVGWRVHTWKLRDDEVCEVDGRRATTVERTLVDLMCLTDRLSAVAAADAAVHQDLVTAAELRGIARTVRQRRGAARSRTWWGLVDGRAESPLETRVRLRAKDGGFPPDELQRRFRLDPGVAYADLAWRLPGDRWLVVEADGRSVHDTPAAAFSDRRRSNALVARRDVDLLRVVWADTTGARTVPDLLSRFLARSRTR